MMNYDVAVIGGGPAGICAALAAGRNSLKTLLVEERDFLGGQLIKQTHRFFGSEEEHAGTRGISIARELTDELNGMKTVEVMKSATALGYYEDDGVLTVLKDKKMLKMKPRSIVLATGAFEKFLPFENNDIPGIFGAGAVQTLMNIYGVKPAQKVLMIGSGNIGLIVSYQLIQAGVDVIGVVEAAPKIGGYLVHASKLRRLGVPILTGHTVKKAIGTTRVTGATICQLDERWQEIEGSERNIDCDAICLAVGLTPLSDILSQMNCKTKYVPELGGIVPVRDENLETSKRGVFVAGDLAGIEEATAAMLEGELAGLNAVKFVNETVDVAERLSELQKGLNGLRAGPVGEKIRAGLNRLDIKIDDTVQKTERTKADISHLAKTGVASHKNIEDKRPPVERREKSYAVIECFQEIPCNPCVGSCPFDAIKPFEDINQTPVVDFERCTGCGSCISKCPGLAIFVENMNSSEGKGTVTLPYEQLPRPVRGQSVRLLSREGEDIGVGTVIRIMDGDRQDKTAVITVEMSKELVPQTRNILVVN
ncbi:MAG TPA: FAD-dependent oxidoreductase [Thermotogota bacterium]|nr:FAD-dependent oxidoreductase [Thermotogota bacterium]HPJ88611.1 FAD-dependent oxidoreductase [Thermotogota bacterium]